MKSQSSQKNLILILLIPLMLTFSGCVYLIVGGFGALGGYVISPDTIEGITETDTIDVWDVAIDVISIMGVIEEQNEDAGLIIAKVSKTKVTITITTLNTTLTKFRVKARKAFLPKINLAQEVYVKVMSQLE